MTWPFRRAAASPAAASPASGPVDVCLLLEGTYPYVAGGVSSWVHDLVRAQSDLSFHIVSLLPDDAPRERRYEPPANVVGISHVYLQKDRKSVV